MKIYAKKIVLICYMKVQVNAHNLHMSKLYLITLAQANVYHMIPMKLHYDALLNLKVMFFKSMVKL